MGFFDRFKQKPTMGIQGQPLEVVSGPGDYDAERNSARIEQLRESIKQFEDNGHGDHPRVAEHKTELAKHLKIRELFHSEEEA
ncbi:MAG: hypothetical protein ABSF52_09450 [Syntrophobacteraceae bacterium]|jgi:hypothetical protein